MKKLMLVLIAASLAIFLGCPKDSPTSPSTPSCAVTGTTVNIGIGTGGGNTTFEFDSSHRMLVTSTQSSIYNGSIQDVGKVSCLDSITSWPNSTGTLSYVARTSGNGYIIKFTDSTYARFIANSYNSTTGIVVITYQYPFTVK